MNIPNKMKVAIAKRMSLVAEMMEAGGLCAPVEWLETPMMLVMHKADIELIALYKRLMKTRRRNMVFGFNGRTFLVPRKLAITVVFGEMKARNMMAAN